MKYGSLLIAGMVLAGSTGMALAQPAGGGRMAACREDMAKYCDGKTGPDRRQCMQDNKSKLSDGCKAALEAGRGAAKDKATTGQ